MPTFLLENDAKLGCNVANAKFFPAIATGDVERLIVADVLLQLPAPCDKKLNFLIFELSGRNGKWVSAGLLERDLKGLVTKRMSHPPVAVQKLHEVLTLRSGPPGETPSLLYAIG